MSTDTARPLGEWLRQRRAELGINLEQAEADTRIRLRYLEALEADDFEALPDPVVGRGFLRNYAAYLDLDLEEAADRYAGLVAPPEPDPLPTEEPSPFTTEPFRPVPLHEMPGRTSGRGALIGLLVVLAAALGLLVWWEYPRLAGWLAREGPTPFPTLTTPTRQTVSLDLPTATHTPTHTAIAPTTPDTATPMLNTPTLEPTWTATWTPSPSPSPSPPIYTGIFLELVFTDTSWIQVTVDGVRQFQGELEAGTYRSWYGEERIELRIGNAGAVEVTVNGQKLGALGAPGEVIDRVFEKVGDEVEAATVTPVATGTVTVEPTTAPTVEPTTTSITPTATITPTTGP